MMEGDNDDDNRNEDYDNQDKATTDPLLKTAEQDDALV